ncbi:Histone deacetylase hda1 [Nowakowskiella sp. JEL0407]|nr:Histone deacetylase hda1 [Nowakowskiella sp. JEL0407]
MTYLLKPLANGKLVLALEGGYNVTAVSESVVACTKVLIGETPPTLSNKPPTIPVPEDREAFDHVFSTRKRRDSVPSDGSVTPASLISDQDQEEVFENPDIDNDEEMESVEENGEVNGIANGVEVDGVKVEEGEGEGMYPKAECVEVVNKVIRIQSKYWKSLATPLHIERENEISTAKIPLHIILKKYRTINLKEHTGLIQMKVTNETVTKNLSVCIYTTPSYADYEGILYLFVHDSYDIVRATMSHTKNNINLSDSYLVDTSTTYITSIVGNESALIDVEIDVDESFERISKKDNDVLEASKNDVARYAVTLISSLWKERIEPSKAKRVVVITSGVGSAAFIKFLNLGFRPGFKRISCCNVLLDTSKTPKIQNHLREWFYKHSFTYIPSSLPKGTVIKSNKDYGNCISNGLEKPSGNEVLAAVHREVFENIAYQLSKEYEAQYE